MATLPGSNSSISLAEIQAEFNLGTGLDAYRGVGWFTDDNTSGAFPQSPNPISLGDFRLKRKTNPVTPFNRIISGDEVFTVPVFNTITFIIRGAGGGGCGWRGQPFGNSGSWGEAGGATFFGNYVTVGGGGGGAYGRRGDDGPGADGGCAGGNGDAPGGNGGLFVVTWVSTKASDKAHYGEKIQIRVGRGGNGGGGGVNFGIFNGRWVPFGNNPPGNRGNDGMVIVQVT